MYIYIHTYIIYIHTHTHIYICACVCGSNESRSARQAQSEASTRQTARKLCTWNCRTPDDFIEDRNMPDLPSYSSRASFGIFCLVLWVCDKKHLHIVRPEMEMPWGTFVNGRGSTGQHHAIKGMLCYRALLKMINFWIQFQYEGVWLDSWTIPY
jgi:hypothetical protein